MGEYDFLVRFMWKYKLWVNNSYGWGYRQTHRQTDEKQTQTHINTMTRPGLGSGQSENLYFVPKVQSFSDGLFGINFLGQVLKSPWFSVTTFTTGEFFLLQLNVSFFAFYLRSRPWELFFLEFNSVMMLFIS